jgi:uncharacterized protein (DUF58 family)
MRASWPWSPRFLPPPLVDAQTLQRIYTAANSPGASPLQAEHEVQHMLLGERQSGFAGRGYEFAEDRPYQRGDEARFINWRALARSGQLYRKTFYEERRPPVYLLIDRRATMRFGTRTRLKVALATQLALFHLYLAQRRSLPLVAVLLDESPRWITQGHLRQGQQELVRQLCAPCPPLPESAGAGELSAVLQQCAVRLAPGCIVIIYSDFHELQAGDLPVLHALAAQHSVYARQVLDPVEWQLPASGEYEFVQAEQETRIDCQAPGLSAHYRQLMQERHAETRDLLIRAGIEHQRYLCNEELFNAGGT